MSGSSRANSPRNTQTPAEWPADVWQAFSNRMCANRTSQGQPYYTRVAMCPPNVDAPEALRSVECDNPFGAAQVTICCNGQQYQRPLHRIRFLLKMRLLGQIPDSQEQASHLCMNMVNSDGRGAQQCCNPDHMIVEDDATNKSRQRCAGWIWIHAFAGHAGGYWYPTCVHAPPCLRYTLKSIVPSQIRGAVVA